MAHLLICTRLFWYECPACNMHSVLTIRSQTERIIKCQPCGLKLMEENSRFGYSVHVLEPTQSSREDHWVIEYNGRRRLLDATQKEEGDPKAPPTLPDAAEQPHPT
jgi:transcription elongation factor Elf1